MSITCVEVRQAVESAAADVKDEIARHAATCPSCRAHQRVVQLLASLEPGDTDTEAVSRIVTSLPLTRWQLRRVATWVPLAAGIGLTWSGFTLLGGVPAGGSISALLNGAGSTVGWSLLSGVDALVAARGSSEALQALVAAGGTWLVLWLVLTGVGSGWLAHALSRRAAGSR